jgi:hypothetical protein
MAGCLPICLAGWLLRAKEAELALSAQLAHLNDRT